MPLQKGASKATIGKNIGEMEGAGYPPKVAVAASLDTARKSAKPGQKPPPPPPGKKAPPVSRETPGGGPADRSMMSPNKGPKR